MTRREIHIDKSKTVFAVNSAEEKLREIQKKLLLNLEFEKAGDTLPYDYSELHAEAEALRAEKKKAVNSMTAEAALLSKFLFEEWEPSRAYEAGDRFLYNGNLYECIEANPVNPTWTPDVTYSYYKPVAKATEDGTLDNPITAVAGMEYEYGKYYSENGTVYLCTRQGEADGGKITLHYLPSALVGQYFEEAIG